MTKNSTPACTTEAQTPTDLTLDVLLQDQQAGRSLQEHIRPRSGLVLHGISFDHCIVPALHLSGDALDFFSLPDGRILAYFLDVSGHGTAAALLSMFIKSTVRYSLALEPAATPASVLAAVSQALLDADMRKYGTMICMIFSPKDNLLEWSHAGHTPRPVFWDGRTAHLLSGQGQPVGLFPGATFADQQLELTEDFALCLFSDGVLDALPGTDLASREAALTALVQEQGAGFSGLCHELLGPASHPDDRSVFVISRKQHE